MLQDVSDMFTAPRRPGAKARAAERPAESPEFAARRARRQDDWEMFRRHAGELLSAPPSDEKHERMIARHGYYFALGGDGLADDAEADEAPQSPRGLNPRVIEAFYGARTLSEFDEVSDDRLRETWNKPAETGAALLYVQGDDGVVSAYLYPCSADALKAEEDAILLAKFTESEALTGRGVIEAHWAAFRAYAEVTSLDGEPSLWDRIQVAWLRVSRPTAVDGRTRPARLWLGSQAVAGFAVAVSIAAMLVSN